MSTETSQSNTHLFTGRDQPKHGEEASRSWWMDAESRAAFSDAVAREEARMRRSKASLFVGSMIVGHVGRQK